jgi:hypothetical protein
LKTLRDYVTAYGPEAGPKLYRTLGSRAAYEGVSTRRRHQIEALTGRPYRLRRPQAQAAAVQPPGEPSQSAVG